MTENDPLAMVVDAERTAQALLLRREPQEALSVLSDAMRKAGPDPVLLCTATTCLLELERVDDALSAAEYAVQLAPTSWRTAHALGSSLLVGATESNDQQRRSLMLAKAARSLGPFVDAGQNIDVAVLLVNVELARSRREEAERLALSVVELHTDDARAHNALGLVALGSATPNRSIKHFERACELQPFDATFQANLAQAKLSHGNVIGAVGAFRRLGEIDGASGDALNGLTSAIVVVATLAFLLYVKAIVHMPAVVQVVYGIASLTLVSFLMARVPPKVRLAAARALATGFGFGAVVFAGFLVICLGGVAFFDGPHHQPLPVAISMVVVGIAMFVGPFVVRSRLAVRNSERNGEQ